MYYKDQGQRLVKTLFILRQIRVNAPYPQATDVVPQPREQGRGRGSWSGLELGFEPMTAA